jgi:Cytochrome oxidase complex assembly protein 1
MGTRSRARQRQQASWISRNWKWFVPVICIGAVVIAVGFFGLIYTAVSGMMKSSDAYKLAVQSAKTNPRVTREIGSPMKEGFFMTGNINLSNDSGLANLAIPISGPKGKGTIYAVASKTKGTWTFSSLVVQVDGRPKIDLKQKLQAEAPETAK